MNKNIRIALVGAILTAVLFTGCAVENTLLEAANTLDEASKAVTNIAVNNEEDTQIKKLISDYFVKMYSDSVANYQKNSEAGSIPDSLRTFIAKRTIDEGNNNAEIGLNYPRFVGLNGITLISYTPLMEADDKKQPQIESTFIEERDGTVLYFSKVNLKSECVLDDIFEANYSLNPDTNTYQKTSDIPENFVDSVLVQTRFDIELIKDGNKYQILRARESTYKQGARNRLFRYNNDFITRLSYLDLTKTADDKDYINKKDGAVYEKEKAIITSFLNNISNLDSERRTLLRGSWDKGETEFKKLITLIGVNKDKDKKEILTLNDEYIQKLPKEALLLQIDINKVKLKDNYIVSLHPAYSQLNKWYIVTFDGAVEKTNGVLGNEQVYSFDYLIKLTGADNNLKIDSVKLNHMSATLKTEAN